VTSRHRTPAELPLDHLIVAATNLEQGVAWIEERLGAHPQPGGKHVAMGTHNALLRIGARVYLEIIAVDPTASAPQRSRTVRAQRPTGGGRPMPSRPRRARAASGLPRGGAYP